MSGDLYNWSFRRSLRVSFGNVRYALRFPWYIRNWLRIWNEYDLAVSIQNNVIPFVCNFHLGDNFLLSAFAGEYCKTYGLQGVFVLAPPNQINLISRLPGVIRVEALKPRDLRFLIDIRFDTRFLAWIAYTRPFSRCVIASSVFLFGGGRPSKARVFPDVFAMGLGMPAETKPAPLPLPSQEELERATKLLESAGLRPSHTVLLAPGSNSLSHEHMPDESWRILARLAKEHGWSVALNRSGCITRIPGTVALDIPLEDLVAIGHACGWVIAQRSGLCDVVAGRIPRLTVLYSIDRQRYDPLQPDPCGRFYSLVESGQDPHAEELFLDDDFDEIKAQELFGGFERL